MVDVWFDVCFVVAAAVVGFTLGMWTPAAVDRAVTCGPDVRGVMTLEAKARRR